MRERFFNRKDLVFGLFIIVVAKFIRCYFIIHFGYVIFGLVNVTFIGIVMPFFIDTNSFYYWKFLLLIIRDC